MALRLAPSWHRHPARGLAAVFVAAFSCSGCDAPPPTTTQDVLGYVRNAAAGAEVRRLDQTAQAYVDAVFKAQAAWRTACKAVTSVADVDKLWALNSDEWRDPDVRSDRLKQFRKWLADEPDSEATDVKTRAQLFAELQSAVAAAPKLPGEGAASLPDNVAAELAYDAERAWLEETACVHETLFAFVDDNADRFDDDKRGLAFQDSETTQVAARLWGKLRDALDQRRRAEIAEIDYLLTTGREERDAAVETKQKLAAAQSTEEYDRRRLRELEILIRYHDARIRQAEARKQELDRAAKPSPPNS